MACIQGISRENRWAMAAGGTTIALVAYLRVAKPNVFSSLRGKGATLIGLVGAPLVSRAAARRFGVEEAPPPISEIDRIQALPQEDRRALFSQWTSRYRFAFEGPPTAFDQLFRDEVITGPSEDTLTQMYDEIDTSQLSLQMNFVMQVGRCAPQSLVDRVTQPDYLDYWRMDNVVLMFDRLTQDQLGDLITQEHVLMYVLLEVSLEPEPAMDFIRQLDQRDVVEKAVMSLSSWKLDAARLAFIKKWTGLGPWRPERLESLDLSERKTLFESWLEPYKDSTYAFDMVFFRRRLSESTMDTLTKLWEECGGRLDRQKCLLVALGPKAPKEWVGEVDINEWTLGDLARVHSHVPAAALQKRIQKAEQLKEFLIAVGTDSYTDLSFLEGYSREVLIEALEGAKDSICWRRTKLERIKAGIGEEAASIFSEARFKDD